MSESAQALPLGWWRWSEHIFDRLCTAQLNPLRHLGALAILAFILAAISGVWLYVMFDTSASGAYESIESLSRSRWSIGGVMRSLHRYAADTVVVLTLLHLLREALHGRWRHFRRFSWLTGCVLLPLFAASAIGGFWLNWDQLGQFSAIATAEWLDAWPFLAQPLARNFLVASTVSDRLFSLFIFVHIGLSLVVMLGLWLHMQRISRAAVWPPRALAVGTIAALLTLALLAPVTSEGPADLATVPATLSYDWILLGIHPLMYATSAAFTWALVLGFGTVLLALPLLPSKTRQPVAIVDPDNCNGCSRCFADCPYAAITMTPHPNGHRGALLAQVDADLCASCGICAGACPSSTPFRSTLDLVSGIEMPQLSIATLRLQLEQRLALRAAHRPIVVFGCREAADSARIAGADVIVVSLLCAGQLAPSFVEYALREGAAGVLIASCREGGCEFRLGARWTAERMRGEREPSLRARVARDHVQLVCADAGEETALAAALNAMRERLDRAGADGGTLRTTLHEH